MKYLRPICAVVLAGVAGFFAGCCSHETHYPFNKWKPSAEEICRAEGMLVGCYNDDLRPFVVYWIREVSRRYPGSVIVSVHGSTVNGQWCAKPDNSPPIPMEEFLLHVRKMYPNRLIVLIACNPGHHDLNFAGVVYGKENIWAIPDNLMSVRDLQKESSIGNIYEFVESRPLSK